MRISLSQELVPWALIVLGCSGGAPPAPPAPQPAHLEARLHAETLEPAEARAEPLETVEPPRPSEVAESAAPPPGYRAVEGTRFALVPRAAALYASPGASDRAHDAARYTFRLGDAWVFRLVAQSDDWVILESLPDFDFSGHCYGTASGLGSMRVRIAARTSELARTPREEIRRELDGGTSIHLQPGVALTPVDGRPNRFIAELQGVRFELEADPGELTSSYQAQLRPQAASAAPGAREYLPNGSRVRYGRGLSLLVEPERTEQAARTSGVFDAIAIGSSSALDVPDRVPVRAVPVADARGLVDVALRCASVRGRAPAGALIERPSASAMGALFGSSGRPHVSAGAPLYWPEGAHAGEATAPIEPLRTEPEGARVCWEQALRFLYSLPRSPSPDHTLRLCTDADRLVECRRDRP